MAAYKYKASATLCPVAIACLPSRSKLEKGEHVIYMYAIVFVHSAACCVTKLEGWWLLDAVSIYLHVNTSAIVVAVVFDYLLREARQ